jgi:hypothetical protein
MTTQCTHQLLMIEPVRFGFNEQTATDNRFQNNTGHSLQEQALAEFNGLVQLLRDNKVAVMVVADTPEPHTPDSIFPNNWISFDADGTIVLYPMYAPNRRQESKQPVLDQLNRAFQVSRTIDLRHFTMEDLFLEGTGSMVLDRVNRLAYACISGRTSETLLNEFCRIMDYRPVVFHATDAAGIDIYHTNVMLCVGEQFAVICLDAITDEDEKQRVLDSFASTGKMVIPLSREQMNAFAGNMLQVATMEEELLLVMSSQAYRALDDDQKTLLESCNRIVHTPLETIESAGGGSARCMLAEVFLPIAYAT